MNCNKSVNASHIPLLALSSSPDVPSLNTYLLNIGQTENKMMKETHQLLAVMELIFQWE